MKQKSSDFKTFRNQIKKLSKSKDHAHIAPHVLEQALDIAEDMLASRKAGTSKISIVPTRKAEKDDKHDQTLMVMIAEDKSFLIDSITADCVYRGHTIEGLLHNTLLVERDKGGKILSLETKISKTQSDAPRESFVVGVISGLLSEEQVVTLESSLQEVITDVHFATRDWQNMRTVLKDCMAELDTVQKAPDHDLFDEYKAFLQYLHDNNFTLLGYREYKLTQTAKTVKSEVIKGKSLGLLSDDKHPAYIDKTRQHLPEDMQRKRLFQETLTVAKVDKRSTVHRRVPLDAIAIKTYDKNGNVIGEKLFIGLFTSVTYSRSVQDIPYLRYKVNAVIEQSAFRYNSHNYRALMHILEKYPRDEIFQIDIPTLKEYAISIMALQEQPKVALYTREDAFKRFISCLVYMPRDRYETNLRTNVQTILEKEMDGVCDNFFTVLDDSPLARVLYTIRFKDNAPQKLNVGKIEKSLIEAARTWKEKLHQNLFSVCDTEQRAFELAQKYENSFPAAYQEDVTPDHVMSDINKMETLKATGDFALDLYHPKDLPAHQLRLKIYHVGSPVTLTDILPILENFGFDVIAERPYKVSLSKDENIWIHDFLIAYRNKSHAMAVKDIKEVLEDALTAIRYGLAENDSLNALVSKAKMPWRDVLVLRAYTKYLRQTNLQYTPVYMMQAVTENPEIADLFLELFYAYHKPVHSPEKRKNLVQTNIKKIRKKLEDVASYDQDRILRCLLQLIEMTWRTNFFQKDASGQDKSYVSFKLNSTGIDFLPHPRPMAEIFVYSPRVEGVHLRGGRIARGGLRWSDRHEDFRTEVLGLMKAQTVKNAVIIPVGAKGGFVVKQPPQGGDRKAFLDEGIACYKIFVSGCLDITDNIIAGKIVPPTDVVRHDSDDPYLVVAADKGTASFSDIANGLSADYNFWLGDAFASGGSAGYDHKGMGITARGAWESVKRHFRELGHNTQEEDFDVIGVGDMAGDVFGNGMLLSPHIRLVGAFNHLHIFCDPEPDPKTTFKERQRLFDEVKGWDHYNEKLLSKGGRIYSRSDKILKLTPEIKKRFDLDKNEVSPLELMHAMLKSQTDLLWFGGIGTYIKAPSEAHSQVGDKANDNIRVDAHEVRAKVIGEGANLGVTHAARIAMNLLGIKLYADFIDNSGGVNSSDLEVNIKILFQQIMQEDGNKMTVNARNKVLEKMTDNVADLVLRNNYQQTQAISVAAFKAYDKLPLHAALIENLETTFGMDRKLEGLPSVAAIEARSREHQGLTTPELSTLVSYSKIKLFKDLDNSTLPDDPAFSIWMESYFPDALQKKYKPEMVDHRLRREIIATQVANSLVNRLGPAFVMHQSLKTGASADMIARVYFIVREAFNLRDVYGEIEALDNIVAAKDQMKALDDIAEFTDYATTWFLKFYRSEDIREGDLAKKGQHYRSGIMALLKALDDVLPEAAKTFIATTKTKHIDKGFPPELAEKIALLPILNTACDIVRIADSQKQDIPTVARTYFGLNQKFSFVWLREQARAIEPSSRWEAETLRGIIDRLYKAQAQLTARIIKDECKDKGCALNPVEIWIENHAKELASVLDIIDHMQETQTVDFPMLTTIEMRLSQLI